MSSIADKIRAIIAKAKSTTHEAEAETLMAKAMQLMEEHQIDAAALNAADPLGDIKGEHKPKSGPSSYREKLNQTLATYYGCKTMWIARANTRALNVYGPESARITYELMSEYVWEQITAAAKAMPGDAGQNRRHIVNALRSRVVEMTQQERPQPTTEAARNALVKIGTELEAYVAERHPNAQATKARMRWHSDAGNVAAGISLSRQTGTTKQQRIA